MTSGAALEEGDCQLDKQRIFFKVIRAQRCSARGVRVARGSRAPFRESDVLISLHGVCRVVDGADLLLSSSPVRAGTL
eukprot:5658125-Prorocentrum_lima.AAC.1